MTSPGTSSPNMGPLSNNTEVGSNEGMDTMNNTTAPSANNNESHANHSCRDDSGTNGTINSNNISNGADAPTVDKQQDITSESGTGESLQQAEKNDASAAIRNNSNGGEVPTLNEEQVMTRETTAESGRKHGSANTDDDKKTKMGKQTEYNDKCKRRKREFHKATTGQEFEKKSEDRFANKDTFEASNAMGRVKNLYESCKERGRPFKKENDETSYATLAIVRAVLKNDAIYKPPHEGHPDDLQPEQIKENKARLRKYLTQELLLTVNPNSHTINSLVGRLGNILNHIKCAPREESRMKFEEAVRDRFCSIEFVRQHLKEKDECRDADCVLCAARITKDSFHTANVKWRDGGMLFYQEMPHLERAYDARQTGILPSPADPGLARALNAPPDTTTSPTNVECMSYEKVGIDNYCWYVGDTNDKERLENSATIFGPLSHYNGCTLDHRDRNFIENVLPAAFSCKGCVQFFDHLIQAHERHLTDNPFLTSSRRLQAKCVELYLHNNPASNKSNECMQHVIHNFCSEYTNDWMGIVERYTKAQFRRDQRVHTAQYEINDHSLIVCMAGAPAQNVHVDHIVPGQFQGGLTLTDNTPMTELFYNVPFISSFQELCQAWSNTPVSRTLDIQVPSSIRAAELSQYLTPNAQSIIKDYGMALWPVSYLHTYYVHYPHGPSGFTNRPGNQVLMSAGFMHAGPGVPACPEGCNLDAANAAAETIYGILSKTRQWTGTSLEPAPKGALRAQIFFTSHTKGNEKYDHDKQYYGFNGNFQIVACLWTSFTEDEQGATKLVIADYIFQSLCDVLPFLEGYAHHPLYHFADIVQQRRNAWTPSNEDDRNWYEDAENIFLLIKQGCPISRNNFHKLLPNKLSSLQIVSLLTSEGVQAVEDANCFCINHSLSRPGIFKMFNQMVETSTQKSAGNNYATIQGTTMRYSKYATESDTGGIETLINGKVFNVDVAEKRDMKTLGISIDDAIIAKITQTRNGMANLVNPTVICNLMRTDKTTKVQDWHYDYPPPTHAGRTNDTNSFSCITPLTLGGSYLQVYNQQTKTPFILHIPCGFTFIFDDNTIHAGGYLFDEDSYDKRLHHYIIFDGGPQLAKGHAVYYYRKGPHDDPQDTRMSCTIPQQFQTAGGSTHEEHLRADGWFFFKDP